MEEYPIAYRQKILKKEHKKRHFWLPGVKYVITCILKGLRVIYLAVLYVVPLWRTLFNMSNIVEMRDIERG